MKIKYERWTKERIVEWFGINRQNCVLNISKLPDKTTKSTKVEYKCLVCNCVNNQTIGYIVYNDVGCIKCSGKESWDQARLMDWFQANRVNCVLNFRKLPEKITNRTRVEYECLKCNYVNNQMINTLVSMNVGCVKCSGNEPWNKIRIINWFKTNRTNCVVNVSKLPKKITSNTKVEYKCVECNFINNQTINNLVYNERGCSKCSASNGHKLTASILDKLKVSYLEEWASKHLKPHTNYRFDFALPQYKIIIEYHGEQHYEPHNFGSKSRTAEEMHAEVCRNDKKKQEIVKAAGWYWLEIPYTLKGDPDTIERMIVEAIHYNNF